MRYEIVAEITGGGMEKTIVGCFDPTTVIVRLMESFPEVTVGLEDLGWRDFDGFKQRGAVEGAIRIAENDARRRGPIWAFRMRTDTKQVITGHAERYYVSLSSEEPIPEPLKSRFVAFLESLRFIC
jgi:hypothetical protein